MSANPQMNSHQQQQQQQQQTSKNTLKVKSPIKSNMASKTENTSETTPIEISFIDDEKNSMTMEYNDEIHTFKHKKNCVDKIKKLFFLEH